LLFWSAKMSFDPNQCFLSVDAYIKMTLKTKDNSFTFFHFLRWEVFCV